ncbi:hypothetical protein B0H66DRAFT_577355 [Apodospora peruviana]|uniref:Uncharacterized protein n=1 Tax=Apodospora peruviana TaxID=516989 RepID=A0AAE0M1K3_9PEZI|nr:hypothetical protein B0H66DRAFT_577355 [Apodospora peruviana]
MRGNKYRVYGAAFSRDRISNNPSLEAAYGPAIFHWGLWVEPKNSKGQGCLLHVEDHPQMNSRTGVIPGGWKFGYRETSAYQSQRFIGRIMIGKLPAGIGPEELKARLATIAVPRQGSEENCITWQFVIDKFMAYALQRFKKWYSSGTWLRAGKAESYVKRKFP